MSNPIYKTRARTTRRPCEDCGTTDIYRASTDRDEEILIDRNEATRSIRVGQTIPAEHVHNCSHNGRRKQ